MLKSIFTKKIQPVWKYSSENILWRILFSDTNFLVGEERDVTNKKTSFFCIDEKNGKILWKNLTLDEQWWIGIEAIVGDKIYFHNFGKPDMPEHKNIIAIELLTGKVLWQNMLCIFLSADENFVYGFRDMFEKRMFYKLDIKTGDILQESVEPFWKEMQKKNENIIFSEIFNKNSEDKIFVENFFKKNDIHIFEHCEYIFLNGKLFCNIYTKNKESLQNTFYIIEKETTKLLYFEILHSSTPYPVPDSFFIRGSNVYYIKEQKELVAITV